MPKMKTHSGAKKRFRLTASGKIKRAKQNKNHILNKKNDQENEKSSQGRIRRRYATKDDGDAYERSEIMEVSYEN